MADTLFGHLCWGLAYHEGPDAVRDFLEATAGPTPPLVISDPLPAGHWPMPVVPPPQPAAYEALLDRVSAGDPSQRVGAHDTVRRLQRRSWVPHDVWSDIAASLDARRLVEALLARRTPPRPELVGAKVAHNTINRLTGRVRDEGGFFFDRQDFPADPVDYDVWVGSPYETARVRQVFEWGLEGGYGRDAGTGLGHLTVEAVEPANLPTERSATPNAVMTLGACVPDVEDPCRGFWNIDVRHGKLGGAWAAIQDEDASTAFKFPVVFLACGAVLLTDQQRPVIGRVVRNVHPTRPEVVTNGRTLTLPLRLSEEAQACLPTA